MPNDKEVVCRNVVPLEKVDFGLNEITVQGGTIYLYVSANGSAITFVPAQEIIQQSDD